MDHYTKKVRSGFRMEKKDGVAVLKIPMFEAQGVERHCFTTRIGGVSKGEFASLNLSRTRENNPANKEENLRRVCGVLGVPYESLTLVNYAHGGGVQYAVAEDRGKGITRESDFPSCDAMLTQAAEVTVVTLHADCVPVFFADQARGVVGAAHAGWKGVCCGVVPNAIKMMGKKCDSKAADILIGIGPHIMKDRFEVKEDVAGVFEREFGEHAVTTRGGSLYVDLQYALLKQLDGCGVLPEHVTCANLCTYANDELFYSHRRDKGKTGAMGSFITV